MTPFDLDYQNGTRVKENSSLMAEKSAVRKRAGYTLKRRIPRIRAYHHVPNKGICSKPKTRLSGRRTSQHTGKPPSRNATQFAERCENFGKTAEVTVLNQSPKSENTSAAPPGDYTTIVVTNELVQKEDLGDLYLLAQPCGPRGLKMNVRIVHRAKTWSIL